MKLPSEPFATAPLLWGMVMALLAVVPLLGTFVVWIPAALFLALEGSWGKALILTAWGGLVVGTIHNLLRPILVGNRLKPISSSANARMVCSRWRSNRRP